MKKDRVYEEVIPAGRIFAGGERYILLHPEPLTPRETWTIGMLCFSVARSGDYLGYQMNSEVSKPTYARYTLVADPESVVIELGWSGEPILVWNGEYEMQPEYDPQTDFLGTLGLQQSPDLAEIYYPPAMHDED